MDENVWKLEIERVNNGYTLKGRFGDSEIATTQVIEDTDDEVSSGEQLLWAVIDYFNFGGSKHDTERITVVREKGDQEAENFIDNHLDGEGGR